MACSTPYCFGDCQECLEDERREKELEDANTDCPHNSKCKWIAVSTKQDKCTTCGEVYNYA